MGEISLLHGDPLPEKPFLLPSLPQTDPLALGIRIDPEKYSQIIGIVKIRMQGIGALYDSKGRRRDGDRSGEGPGSAGKGTVSEGLSGLQRQENLLFEALIAHIASGLRQALGRSLLWAQEKFVHMQHGASVSFSQNAGKCRLSCGAWTVNCQKNALFLGEKPVNMGK